MLGGVVSDSLESSYWANAESLVVAFALCLREQSFFHALYEVNQGCLLLPGCFSDLFVQCSQLESSVKVGSEKDSH